MRNTSEYQQTKNLPALTLEKLTASLDINCVPGANSADPHQIVTSVEFYDPSTPPEMAGTLILAPGAQLLPALEIENLIGYARKHSCLAIAVKADRQQFTQLAALAATRIPLLQVPVEVSWALFEAQINKLIGENSRTAGISLDQAREPLFSLVNELATFFTGSVVIEDLSRRILAYSTVPGQKIDALRMEGILSRRVPDSPFNDQQYRKLLRSEEIEHFPQHGSELPRTAVVIRAGNMPLGSIWAIDTRSEATRTQPETRTLLDKAAKLAAAHMLEALHYRETTQLPREQLLRTLVSGTNVQGSELSRLGFAPERGVELVAISTGVEDDPNLLAQLRAATQRHLSAHVPEVVTAIHGSLVWALLPASKHFSGSQLLPKLLETSRQTLDTAICAALPGTCDTAETVSKLASVATQLFVTNQHYPATQPRQLLQPQELKPLLILTAVNDALQTHPELLNASVSSLQKADPQLAKTLLVWCENRGNIAQCARELQVHENTVRGRLQKASNEYALNLNDPDTFLTVWLQLRISAVN